jgi:hypothetical protein
MDRDSSMVWKITTAVCVVLLVGSAVAIVVLATNRGDDGGKKELEDQVEDLKEQVNDLEGEVESLSQELAAAEDEAKDEEDDDSDGAEAADTTSDYDKLYALGEAMCGDKFHVGEIVIDGNWARVSIAPNDPMTYQGENCYYHKEAGAWNCVDCGTGLQYGDIPGAPASIFPA